MKISDITYQLDRNFDSIRALLCIKENIALTVVPKFGMQVRVSAPRMLQGRKFAQETLSAPIPSDSRHSINVIPSHPIWNVLQCNFCMSAKMSGTVWT